MTARLAGFETLNKSSRQLADEYFVPALQVRQQVKKDAADDPAMSQKPDAAAERQAGRGRPNRWRRRASRAKCSPS